MPSTHTTDSKLQRAEVLEASLKAFAKRLISLRIFSTAFAPRLDENSTKMEVPYYPLHGAASVSRTPTQDYFALAANTATEAREVDVNQNLLQALSYTNEQRKRNKYLDPETLGNQAADRLARDIMAQIFGVFTAANFPGASLAALASGDFDFTAATELQEKCTTDEWPEEMRALILKPEYHTGLVGGMPAFTLQNTGDELFREGAVNRVAGFDLHQFASLPANGGTKLRGVAVYPSAVLAAFAPIEPTEAIASQLYDYQLLTDENTGISLMYKHIADAATGQEVEVIETHFGLAVGEAAAAKLIVAP